MKKIYKIEVDCPHCASKVEIAVRKTEGVADATVNFLSGKMTVEFADGTDVAALEKELSKKCKRIDPDFSMKT